MGAIERQQQKPAIWLALLLPLLMLSGCGGPPEQIFQHAYFDSQTCSTDPKDNTLARQPTNPIKIKCEKPTQPQEPAPITDQKITVAPGTSTITVTIKPAAPPKLKANNLGVHAVKACPDTGAPESSGSGTPSFRACEARIVKAAMDYCNSNVLRENDDFLRADFASAAAGLALGATAGLVSAAAGAKPATSALVAGIATALGTAGASGGKLLQAPGTVKQGDMVTAAQQYLYVAGPVPDDQCEAEDYYAGLFNAVGTACPAGSFNKLHTLNDAIKGRRPRPFDDGMTFSEAKKKLCSSGELKLP